MERVSIAVATPDWEAGPDVLDGRADLAALRQRRIISGLTPFLLDDPARATYLVSGEIDLFLVELRDGEPVGARRYLCSFGAGSLLFGIDGSDLLVPVGLLAVGTVGTEIYELPLAVLQHWATQPRWQTELGLMIDAWVEALCEAGSRPLRPHPRIDLVLAPGDEARVEAHQRLSVGRGIGWVSADRGELLLFDIQDLINEGPNAPVPLCPSSWLSLGGSAQARCEATQAVLADGRVWRGLAVLHAGLIESVPMSLRLAAVDEANRLRARLEADANARDAAIAALGSTAPTRRRTRPVPGAGEPLFKACKALGQAAGFEVRLPEQRPDQPQLSLEAILRASRLRKRQVALENAWWQDDVGSFLLVRSDDRPAAVLRRDRGYQLYDPHDDSTTPLTPAMAGALTGTGFVFYEPMPDAAITPMGLLRRSLDKGGADLGAILGFGMFGGLLAMALPIATATMVDTVIPGNDWPGLIEMSLILAAIALLQFLVQFALQRASLRFLGQATARLQTGLIDRLLRLPVGFFRGFTSGDLMTRVLAVQAIENALTGAVIGSLLSSFFTAVSVGMMIYYAPALGLLALAMVLLLALVIGLLGLLRLPPERQSIVLRGRLSHMLHEMAGGVAKFRLAAAEERVYGRWAHDQAALAQYSNHSRDIDLVGEVLASTFPPLAQGIVFTAIVYFGMAHQGLGLGTVIAFLAAFGQAVGGITSLSQTAQDLMALGPTLNHARPILATSPESPQNRLDPGELSGGIEISHVDFRYAPNAPLVLQDFSLQIEPGEFVALVGPSGCGKSTLLRLLLAFETPEAGAVLFDGKDAQGLDISALRRQMGVVMQDGQLFPGSLLENILGSNLHLSEEAAWWAAESAGLADEIREMPMGMQTVCGNGIGLSGGQVQRVMVARALVNRPRILLLDEATSALDNRTQAIVTESLSRLRSTRIVIAHRLSTVISADRIIVMRNGQVVESGTYDELQNLGGFFSELASRQNM